MFTRNSLHNSARPVQAIASPAPQPSSLAERIETAAVATLPGEGLVVVGKGTRMSGKITDCRKLDVFGVIEADVVAEMIVVHEGGGLKGNVQVDRADIHGVVEGALQVYEHLEIHRTGEITGDVSYGSLSVAAGAKLVGSVQAQVDFRTANAERDVQSAVVEQAFNGSINGHGSSSVGPVHARPQVQH